MPTTQLAEFSNVLIVVAIVLYTIAFIVFCVELARVSSAWSDRRLARKRAAAESAVAEEPATVASASRYRSATAVLDRPSSTGGSGAGATGAVAAETHDAAGAGRTGRAAEAAKRASSLALALTGTGFAAHLLGVVLRALSVSRVPWGNMYEFAISGTCLTVGIFLVLVKWKNLRYLGTFLLGPVLLLMMAAQTLFYLPAEELTPSLQNSHWLVIHVLVAVISTGLFTVGFVATVMQLVQDRREGANAKRLQEGHEPKKSVLSVLPASREFEELSFKLNAIGFVTWTFTLIAGAIWAQYAWGRFWGWDPKETWTFVIWVIYAAYLHARSTRGFRGRPAAYFSIVAYLCVIANFTVVNTVFNGLHSYSGL